jgi:RES domain-containing protein
MLVYRITPKIYMSSLFAPGIPGRWNSAGKLVIYAAESIALAFTENIIRRKGLGFGNDYGIMYIEIPDTLEITKIEPSKLLAGWRSFTDYSICQAIGDTWYNKSITPILKVPSAVLPSDYNFVLNSMHSEFKKIKLVGTSDLIPDDRIEDLLKKYPAKS